MDTAFIKKKSKRVELIRDYEDFRLSSIPVMEPDDFIIQYQ